MEEGLGVVGCCSLYLLIVPWDVVEEDLGECLGHYNLYILIVPRDGMEGGLSVCGLL